jgi:hypothetical protein
MAVSVVVGLRYMSISILSGCTYDARKIKHKIHSCQTGKRDLPMS